MKKLLTIIASILVSVSVFAQTPTNYKEGDFSGKAVKAKIITLDNNWTVTKTSTGVLTLSYNKTGVLTLSGSGEVYLASYLGGTTAVRDTASFATTATRKAVYIAGCTSASIFAVTPKGTAQSGVRIVAGDICNWRAITDSLIVTRQAGTTSGLTFSFIRLK